MSEVLRAGAPSAVQVAVAPEDQVRADLYALLGTLYAGAPNQSLLRAIARSPGLDPPAFVDRAGSQALGLAATWDSLRAASEATTAEAAEQEYVDLFVGVGKCEINLHASHWLTGFMMDRPLAELRKTLADLGLKRRPDAALVEDHLSALCETMRLLIAGSSGHVPVDAAIQRRFLADHIDPWIGRCTERLRNHAIANYYRRVAEFTQSFMALERESLAIE